MLGHSLPKIVLTVKAKEMARLFWEWLNIKYILEIFKLFQIYKGWLMMRMGVSG